MNTKNKAGKDGHTKTLWRERFPAKSLNCGYVTFQKSKLGHDSVFELSDLISIGPILFLIGKVKQIIKTLLLADHEAQTEGFTVKIQCF